MRLLKIRITSIIISIYYWEKDCEILSLFMSRDTFGHVGRICARCRWDGDCERGRKGPRSHKLRYRTTWIRERGVEDRAKRRTCQNSNGPYIYSIYPDRWEKAARSYSDYTRRSPRLRSRRLRRTRSIVAKCTMRPRWVPLRSSSTGVSQRPQGSQGEGTSHAPAMSEKSTPLRRGVHTLTRPISIRA